jgi:PAS domain S-box-containing protein
MKAPATPADEKARKAALDALGVLDTPADPRFTELTDLVAAICEVPIALVSLVDSKRQWFKARTGLEASETPREISFCGHAILGDEIFEIEDARSSPDFCDNPLVTGAPKIAFYAGAPLVTSSGHRVGTLCVIDRKPRKLTPLQRTTLQTLARQVVELLEQGRYRESAQQLSEQLQEAQQTARVGSWQESLVTGELHWSKELYRIFEIDEPQHHDVLRRLYRQRLGAEDLAELDRLTERAVSQGIGFVYDHRVLFDGGTRVKYVQRIGKVTRDASGKPILLSGTCRDRTWDVESESRYRSLIETMGEGLVVQAADGRIMAHNPAALRILGLTSDQLHGRSSTDPRWRSVREDGSDFPGSEHPAMVALRTGEPVPDVTMGLHLPDGTMRWIRIHAVPMEGPQGRTVTTTFSDITDLVQAQAENRVVLDTLGIGVWKYNPVTQELDWDSSMYRLYEVDPKAFSGHYEAWQSLLTEEARSRAIQAVEDALAGRREFNLTFEVKTPGGRRKHIAGRATVVMDEQGRPRMMYGVNWDRSKEFEMEAHLQQERAKALQSAKLASLGEMAAGIAHEINNPLAVIAGNLHLLTQLRTHPERFESKIEAATRATERVTKIVNGLRKFSRSSEGSARKPERISSLVGEALVLVETKARRQSVEIILDLRSEAVIECDGLEIEQVIVNLVNNAIDAAHSNPDPSAPRWVRIESFDIPSGLGSEPVLRVEDSGKGVSPEVEARLFEPFFTTKPVGQGTGLGLSIARGILQEHGASLSLNRAVPHTCFEVRFAHVP